MIVVQYGKVRSPVRATTPGVVHRPERLVFEEDGLELCCHFPLAELPEQFVAWIGVGTTSALPS